MKEGYSFVFGMLLGGMISPYLIAAAHDFERRWHERQKPKPLMYYRLRPYMSPYTFKREVILR